jgi:hypothetical protein
MTLCVSHKLRLKNNLSQSIIECQLKNIEVCEIDLYIPAYDISIKAIFGLLLRYGETLWRVLKYSVLYY